MQCPFLKKISFKKVSQIVSDDAAFDEVREITGDSLPPPEEDFDFPEENIELINSSEVNKHDVYYFNSRINIPQSSNNRLQIKYPKQLECKHMIASSELMEIAQEETTESMISESELSEGKNVPHILISKLSMLTAKCEDIFHGEVILQDQSQNINHCQIKERCIRITRGEKVKYFIELQKCNCTLEKIRQNRCQLAASRSNSQIKLNLRFFSYKKVLAFLKALQLNLLQIDHERQIKSAEPQTQNQLNLSYSMDSLGFQVERMEISRLKEVGQTFDILLFKNKSLMSKVQRVFTNSDYDHTAMLLKTNTNEIFILESSSNSGVAIYTLDSLVNLPRKKYYFRIGLRQYRGERKCSVILQLQEFIRQAIGKRYKFDPMYLLSSQVVKDDTYFCSELISSALQKVGLMNTSKPPYKYLPKHFASQQINDSLTAGRYSQIVILE